MERGLFVHQSHRVERLADMLAERALSAPPLDPMTPITVVVGSRGMERWLRHRLAERLGACANFAFRFPGGVFDELLAHALDEPLATAGPWSPDALTFAILEVLPTLADVMGNAWKSTGTVDRKRYALARELAGIVDRYVHQRPDWIAAWAAGRTAVDEPDERFQAALVRALTARLGDTHLAARAARFAKKPSPASPFPGLHVFGISTLPRLHLEVLTHVATRVELYAFCPSDLYWGDLRARRLPGVPITEGDLPRENRLLTSLGRLSSDFQRVLEEVGGYREGAIDFPRSPPSTLLATLQTDILDLRADAPGRTLSPHDDSVQIHACVGPLRQVETLRDALLRLFDDHPEIEPRDVLVMTPDVERYAPLVHAVFGQGKDDGHGLRRIPVEIVDRALNRENPFAEALLRLLELCRGRVRVSDAMDLLALPPVLARFGLEPEDLAELREMVDASGIRHGLDAADRAREGQPADDAFTFAHGLDRLALGVTSADDGDWLFSGVAPYDALEGARATRFGALAAFTELLSTARATLLDPRTLAQWIVTLRAELDALTAATKETAWQRERVLGELSELDDLARGTSAVVGLDALALALEGRFGLPRGADRRITGSVTVCALAPMRSVPFAVIALLGVDDDAGFPRARAPAGLDLMPKHPRVGDRDPRDEDRHLLLEAILSARAHLLVLYSGRDEREGATRPPAAPIAELLDAIDEAIPGARAVVLREAPLQPFAREAFTGPNRSFDPEMLAAAKRLLPPRGTATAAPFGATLPSLSIVSLTIEELTELLVEPARTLLRGRLGLSLYGGDDTLDDHEPVLPDHLDEFFLAERLMELEDQRLPVSEMLADVRARGLVPAGALGEHFVEETLANVRALTRAAPSPRRTYDVALDLGGVRLTGRVKDVADGVLWDVRYQRLDKPKRLMTAWVRLLAVAAAHRVSRAELRAKPIDGVPPRAILHAPHDPLERLRDLVELYRDGMCRPMLAFPDLAHAWVTRKNTNTGQLLEKWTGGEGKPGVAQNPWVQMLFPDGPPFLDPEGRPTRAFTDAAERAWGPLMAAWEKGKARP